MKRYFCSIKQLIISHLDKCKKKQSPQKWKNGFHSTHLPGAAHISNIRPAYFFDKALWRRNVRGHTLADVINLFHIEWCLIALAKALAHGHTRTLNIWVVVCAVWWTASRKPIHKQPANHTQKHTVAKWMAERRGSVCTVSFSFMSQSVMAQTKNYRAYGISILPFANNYICKDSFFFSLSLSLNNSIRFIYCKQQSLMQHTLMSFIRIRSLS